MRSVMLQNLQLDLDSRRFRSAVAGAQRLGEARPGDAATMVRMGEAYRALGPRKPRLSENELTYWSQRRAYLDEHNRSEEEQFRRLEATPEGKAALEANRAKAEEFFQKAAALAPNLADPHLGLGMLYQDEGRKADASAEFRRYLELAPDGPEGLRVERRLENLRSGVAK
jgi:tetratricopeptide (TPR) repeat protein